MADGWPAMVCSPAAGALSGSHSAVVGGLGWHSWRATAVPAAALGLAAARRIVAAAAAAVAGSTPCGGAV